MPKCNEEEAKTLKLFNFVFLTYFAIGALLQIFAPTIKQFFMCNPEATLIGLLMGASILLFAIVIILFAASFFVLGFQSAKILQKYGLTKTRPVFWLILLFIPLLGLITAIILWANNHRLLKETKLA
ncbi:MAG: hypothetical protein WC442_00150 [Candidatus Omnitrophota bacterium]